MKGLLMIAFHFPPFAGSSGLQRTLRFVQHLPSLGWQPIVLSAHPRAYDQITDDLIQEIPPGVVVKRAFALDAARHLSMFRRYPAFLARPDRWLAWRWGAVPAAMKLVRRYRPAAVWSTYPIATAHLIGAAVRAHTGLPWIADFRDPMAQDGYPADPRTWRSFKSIEEQALRSAARSVFTTPGAARVYRERYPDVPADRVAVIENGYDEATFADVPREAGPLDPGKVTLLHSGIIYPSERDPTQLFQALRRLLDAGRVSPATLNIRLRAAVHEGFLRKLIGEYALGGFVTLAPPIPYRQAIVEMMGADGLLVMQASNCNEQIPAKIYEYVRARRPIFALTDPAGDTAGVLREAGLDSICRLDSVEEIAERLPRFVEQVRAGTAPLPSAEFAKRASRLERSRALAGLLEQVTG